MNSARSLSRFIVGSMLCLLLLPAIAFAKSSSSEPVARMSASGSVAIWTTAVSHDKIALTVVSPDGSVFQKEFAAGVTPMFRLQDLGGKVSDGSYTYEMRVIPNVSSDVKRQLAAAREAGDDAAAARIQRDAGLAELMVQSGTLSVSGGAFINPDATEPVPHQPAAASTSSGTTSASSISSPHNPTALDIVQADDVIIQGSLCVGLDCVNNESFGFDTIRLKENNTRIKFDDTSTSTGFPNHDWQLTANDSASGGANKFSIEDITAATVPVTVTGSAPTNSIFVDSTGRVGFRTATPVLDLHVSTSNTPGLRLEQNNSGGFTAQTWDIAGNEANFFVRDVTGGSRLPFRIRPGAPTSSIDIAASGNVGVGTASPSARLHVVSTVADVPYLLVNNTTPDTYLHGFGGNSDTTPFIATLNNITPASATFGWGFFNRSTEGNLQIARKNNSTTWTPVVTVDRGNGNVGLGTTSPTSKLQVVGLSVFANNAAAVAGGLTAGAFYRTGGDPDLVCVVH
jgi:hypothetical protein